MYNHVCVFSFVDIEDINNHVVTMILVRTVIKFTISAKEMSMFCAWGLSSLKNVHPRAALKRRSLIEPINL